MTKLRCCFCGQELQEDVGYDGDYSCPNCKEPYFGSPELWQELIRTRKALEQSEICCTEWEKQALDYKAENIALSGDLERTRKENEDKQAVLNCVVDMLKVLNQKYTFEH